MHGVFQSKFVQIIKTWDEDEIRSFEIWLKSPWCNTNKNLPRLFDQLKKYYPVFSNQKLTKEKLFKKILPSGKFSTRRMNNLLSEAYLSAERFLVFQNLTKDELLKKDLLSKEFQQRHLEDWFFRDTEKEILRLENQSVKNWEDHLALLQLHRRIYHHPNQNPRMLPGSTRIVEMGKQIDLVYLLEKAAIINEKIFRNRILKNENHDVQSELKKWWILSEGIDHPAIDFYRMRFNYSDENRLEQYMKLRTAFMERFGELNEKEQKVHFISLLNDTTLLVRAGVLDITELLPIYKTVLKTDILFNRGLITYATYVKILSASNVKKDFDFSEQFIEQYTTKLDKQFQADAIYWARGHTAYYQEDYVECLNILLSHDFKAQYFQMIGKILNTQVYFDLYLLDSSYSIYLFNYFDSFEKWILREKFRSEFTKKSYLRFVQLCRTLAKIYDDVNFQPKKIRSLFENEKNTQALKWLLQKKEEILKLKERRLS